MARDDQIRTRRELALALGVPAGELSRWIHRTDWLFRRSPPWPHEVLDTMIIWAQRTFGSPRSVSWYRQPADQANAIAAGAPFRICHNPACTNGLLPPYYVSPITHICEECRGEYVKEFVRAIAIAATAAADDGDSAGDDAGDVVDPPPTAAAAATPSLADADVVGLTAQELDVYRRFFVERQTQERIAAALSVTQGRIAHVVANIRRKFEHAGRSLVRAARRRAG